MPFLLHTDHQRLMHLHNMRLVDSRLARTVEDLADFHYTIQYTPGSQNAAADGMSRLYDPNSVHSQGGAQQIFNHLSYGLRVFEVPGEEMPSSQP